MADPKAPVGSCREPAFVGAAVPSYPASVFAAPEARRTAGDRSTSLERRAATVAVRTAQDIWLRTFRIPDATGTTPGLRGGAADWDYSAYPDHAVMTLHDVVFADGVSVSGTSDLVYGSNGFDVHVVVKAGGSTIVLDGAGQWGFGGPFETVTLTGSTGGRALRLEVPAEPNGVAPAAFRWLAIDALVGRLVVDRDLDPESSAETVELVRSAGGRIDAVAPVDLATEDGARSWVDGAAESAGASTSWSTTRRPSDSARSTN